MVLTRRYEVFFATPFSAPIKSMYDDIIKDFEASGLDKDFHFTHGTTSVILPSPDYFTIEQFKAQNQDFLTRFVDVIRISDIVIADLTNNNPSVHLELGIALVFNKNILRVTGQDFAHIATDLNGYEALKYARKEDLSERIRGYLMFFLSIKKQELSQVISEWVEIGPRTTDAGILNQSQFRSYSLNQVMRDGEISIRFKFKASVDIHDWFAVLLRAASPNPWIGSGYFVYVRRRGALEIREMGTLAVLGLDKSYSPFVSEDEHVLRVNIDGNHIFASVDEELPQGDHSDKVQNQSAGLVVLGCYRSNVLFSDVRLANHDTIANR